MVTDFITAGALASLLRAAHDPVLQRAGEIADRLGARQQLRLSRQPAARTAESLRLKYTLARDRGVPVDGLDQLVARLSALGETPIRACVAEVDDEFALVVLTDDGGEVESAICVVTSDPEISGMHY